MNLSIITPVLNEASGIAAFLRHTRANAPSAEIVVVDGGSEDATLELARNLAHELRLQLLQTEPGRAHQMNMGARAACGDVLWFLHADSVVPPDCEPVIAQTLAQPGIVAGCFRLRFPRANWIYRISDSWGNLAVDLFGFAFGDHGIFCRREHFEAVGGFPNVPLMEDAEFCRALNKFGRMRQVPLQIQTSPRRYERHGPLLTTLIYLLILALYLCRVDFARLARVHQWFSTASRSSRQTRPPRRGLIISSEGNVNNSLN